MPDLAIGSGIATGVNNFVNSFMQVRRMKHEEKLRQNDKLIAILTHQLEKDDTLTYDEQANILDQIPPLLGIKNMPSRLSEHFGLDKMVADPNKPAQKGQAGKTSGQISSEFGYGTEELSPNFKPTQATEDVPEGTIRKGALSPLQIKQRLVLESRKAEKEGDFDYQARVLQLNYELQRKILGKNGYDKVISKGFDDEGNYIITMANSQAETKTINLGKHTPEAIFKAGIESGRPSQQLKAREEYYLNDPDNAGNPRINPKTNKSYSQSEAYAAALEDLNTDFKSKITLREKQGEAVTQNVKGTKPKTQAQIDDDARADQTTRLKIEEDRDNATADLNAAQGTIVDLTGRKKTAQQELDSAKAEMETQKSNYSPDDPSYRAATTRLNKAQQNFDNLANRLNTATVNHRRANDRLIGANNRLNSIGGNSSSNPIVISPEQKQTIDKIRQKNPDTTKNMTDIEILNAARNQSKQ